MKKNMISVLICLGTSLCGAEQVFLQPFSPAVNIMSNTGVILGKAGYSIPPGYAFWTFEQWGSPANLVPQAFPANQSWQLANANSRIRFYPQLDGMSNVIELAAANVPCSLGSPTEANELDVFLQPAAMEESAQALGSMGQLNASVALQWFYGNKHTTCRANQSGHIYALLLRNSVTADWLFLQINLGGTNSPLS